MLQKVDIEEDYLQEQPDRSHLLRPSYYWELLKRRILYFLVPFCIVLPAGLALSLLWPATYLASGKILVTTQQIPTELVRPTVTTLANERIQSIQQRVLTRDNLLAIVTKFNLFPSRRNLLSATELTELMRRAIQVQPLVFTNSRAGSDTLAFTVGFFYEDARVAAQVANDLMTRILNEDLRDRTGRAVDTTRFLTREMQRLNEEYASLDARIAQLKRTQPSTKNDQPSGALAQLRAEYIQKSQIYSAKHPALQTLKNQIAAFEKAGESATAPADTAAPAGLDALESQQASVQKNLDMTSQKLAAARLGETLERDQQSEKFEVIEQPSEPQESFKPNRPRMMGFSLALALASGFGLAFLREIADRSVRRSADLISVASPSMVISIPYIETDAERRRARRKVIVLSLLGCLIVIGAMGATIAFMPPLDLMAAKLRVLLSR